jgi:hypothetical protein
LPPLGQSRGEIDELKKLMRCVGREVYQPNCGEVLFRYFDWVFERFESNFLRVLNFFSGGIGIKFLKAEKSMGGFALSNIPSW